MRDNIKIFASNIEEEALKQIDIMSEMGMFKDKSIRIMPDVHLSTNSVVGFSSPIDLEDDMNGISPCILGSDVGCMVSSLFFDKGINVEDIPELEHKIRKDVPFGKEINRKKKIEPKDIMKAFNKALHRLVSIYPSYGPYVAEFRNEKDLEKYCNRIRMDYGMFLKSLGSVGMGNHFIEYGVNEEENAYCLAVHCGSRNFGSRVFNYHQGIALKKKDGDGCLKSSDFHRYVIDVILAQEYAKLNHMVIHKDLMGVYKKLCGGKCIKEMFVMHNFIDYSSPIPMIRKGCISAKSGEEVLIPFNMCDGMAYGVGKGNEDWNHSAPHGAGRIMSRNQARKNLDIKEYQKRLEENGVYSTTANEMTIDESPMAYKDMEGILGMIGPTVDVRYIMKPKMNIKGC